MAWAPQLGEGEQSLVQLDLALPNGTPFHLLVTDRQVAYSKYGGFGALAPVKTVAVDRRELRNLELLRRSPLWPLVLGAGLVALIVAYAVLFLRGELEGCHGQFVLLVGGLGAALLVSARHRWRLRFRVERKVHLIDQPMVMKTAMRDAIALALRRTYEILRR